MKRVLLLTVLFGLCGLTALAADISGTWKATSNGQNGPMERTFVFKVEGNKLTGETTSPTYGKSTLENGKVDGDKLSFTITIKFQDNEMKVNYKGQLSGSELKLTGEIEGAGMTIEWVAKKIS
jgi:hypothetical protein